MRICENGGMTSEVRMQNVGCRMRERSGGNQLSVVSGCNEMESQGQFRASPNTIRRHSRLPACATAGGAGSGGRYKSSDSSANLNKEKGARVAGRGLGNGTPALPGRRDGG